MPGVNYVLNTAGMKLDEERMSNIPYPRWELYTHVTARTVNAGALIGTFFAAPITAYAKGQLNGSGMKHWARTCGKYGVVTGIIAGPILTTMALRGKKASYDSIVDRCYRLRYNKCQVRVDRLSLVGVASGCAAAAYLGESYMLGGLIGINAGMLFAAAVNTML